MFKTPANFSGRYRIENSLGRGGMAEVYRAFDLRLERYVALKVIRSGLTDESFLRRFELEAKSLAQMDHPNIVKILDYGEEEGIPYLVMVYLPGGTLKQRLGSPIPSREAARLLAPIAQALDYAHEMKIIHRDVKPSNILMTAKNLPMLTDFGIAKILESNLSLHLTSTGMGIGTPEYMAPEQWLGNVVPQTDIYSLGVVFFEMVTGKLPYSAETPAAILLKVNNDPLPRPKQLIPTLSDSVENTIFKALAKRPEDRFDDMGKFAAALDDLAHGIEPDVQISYQGTQLFASAQVKREQSTAGDQAAKALVASAEKLEVQGNAESALDLYRQASSLSTPGNPLYTAIEQSIHRLESRSQISTGQTMPRTPTPPSGVSPVSKPVQAPPAPISATGSKKKGWIWAVGGAAAFTLLVVGIVAILGISSLLRNRINTPTSTLRMTKTSIAEVLPTATPRPRSTITPSLTPENTLATTPPTATASPPKPTATASDEILAQVTNSQCGEGDIIKSIQAVGTSKVRFTLCKTNPRLLQLLALPELSIHPAKDDYTGVKPIGTGPYILENWSRGSNLTLQPYQSYWDTPTRQSVVFQWSDDPAVRLSSVYAGSVDLATYLDSVDYSGVSHNTNLVLLRQSSPSIVFIGINSSIQPFSNVKVRQALAMGINRDRIVRDALPEGSEVVDYTLPCDIPNACKGTPWYDYDPDQAKVLLTEAGYPNGFQMTIYLRPGYRWYLPVPELLASALQEELKGINITANVEYLDNQPYREAINNNSINGIFVMSWYSTVLHPAEPSGTMTTSNLQNYPEWFPELADLANQIELEPFSLDIYSNFTDAFRDQVPYIPLGHTYYHHVAQKNLANIQMNPLGVFHFSTAETGEDAIRVIDELEPENLSCATSNQYAICSQIYESLVTYNADNQIVPLLAESWEASEDGLTWTFNLRQNVLFHDGSILDAVDVIASFAVILDASNSNFQKDTGSTAVSYFGLLND